MKELICNFTRFTPFVVLIMICTLLWTCQQPKFVEETKPWVGKWTVVEGIDSSGVKFSDTGVYHYYNNGTFSSQLITSLDRPNLTANPSTPGEYMAAFDVYRAGFGTYTINEQEDTLTYQYTSNLRPHRIAQPTKVSFTVDDDLMTLIYNAGQITITLKREKID